MGLEGTGKDSVREGFPEMMTLKLSLNGRIRVSKAKQGRACYTCRKGELHA